MPIEAPSSVPDPDPEEIVEIERDIATHPQEAAIRGDIRRRVDPLGLDGDGESAGFGTLALVEGAIGGYRGKLRRLKVDYDLALASENAGTINPVGRASTVIAAERVEILRRLTSAQRQRLRVVDRESREKILASAELDFNSTMADGNISPRDKCLAEIKWLQLQVANGRGGCLRHIPAVKARYVELTGEEPPR